MEKWKKRSSRDIHRDKWIALRADTCELPGGRILEPFYVVEQRDSVHIVPVDASGRVLIPCGVVEPGEAPLVAAQRELKEETGHVAANWVAIISPFANPARLTNRIHCFLARDITDTGMRELDDSEEIEFEWMAESEVRKRIFAGEFSQALHIASVYAVWDYLSGGE
jgi:ADP-ribose pyrophosphatase